MSYTDNVIDLIERALEGSDEGEPNKLKNAPPKEPGELFDAVEDDMTGPDFDLDEGPDEEDDYPDQYGEKGIASEMVDLTLLDQDNSYQAYFRTVMAKHDIKGIRGLSSEKRSTFFRDVSSGWKNHNDNKNNHKKVKEGKEILYQDYKKYFNYMLEKCEIDDFGVLTEEEQVEFYTLVYESFLLGDEILLHEDYKSYFKGMMKTHDVKNIADLSTEDKKAFFKKVDAGWKGKEEVKEQKLYEDYKAHFKVMMKKHGVSNIGDLSGGEKKKFFGAVNKSWKSKEELGELMQKPGEGYEKGMLRRPEPKQPKPVERLKHSGAALAMRQVPTKMYAAGQTRRI